MKPFILLQTDFSESWPAVSEMKGVIAQVDPELKTVDITHDIPNYSAWEASLSLNTAEPFWPKGTIFVSVVDPGVGTARKASAALLNDGNYVITPDNGTLTHLLHRVGIQSIREIDETINRYQPEEAVSVFEGRDVFAYTAARLASGQISFKETGRPYPVSDVVQCREYAVKPYLSDSVCTGFIMTGNLHFGGIEFNITNEAWKQLGMTEGTSFHIQIQHHEKTYFDETVSYVPSFGYAAKGEPVLYCGSSRYLSLDLNQDNLMQKYHIGTGLEWIYKIERTEV